MKQSYSLFRPIASRTIHPITCDCLVCYCLKIRDRALAQSLGPRALAALTAKALPSPGAVQSLG